MKPLPKDPVAQHAIFMEAFTQDLLARDYHAPRAKAVSAVSKAMEKGK